MEIYTGLIEFNWTLVMVWVTVLVLYLILKRNFFDKINNFITARQEGIQKQFDEAEQSIADANAMMGNIPTRLSHLRSGWRSSRQAHAIAAVVQFGPCRRMRGGKSSIRRKIGMWSQK